MDFRDHHIKKALDEAIGPYRPERTRRARVARIVTIAALAFATVLGFWIALHYSTPRPPPAADRRPVSVQILPAPAKR